MNDAQDGSDSPIIVKKYANRRLYNTESSRYVTLDHLAQMVRDGKDFEVRDARSGEDITRSVLAQIIFEEENKGQRLLPVGFLRQLIQFYGDGLQTFLPRYLETSMENFTRNQENVRRKFADVPNGRRALKDPGVKDPRDPTQKKSADARRGHEGLERRFPRPRNSRVEGTAGGDVRTNCAAVGEGLVASLS